MTIIKTYDRDLQTFC